MANMICIWEMLFSTPIHFAVFHMFTHDLLQQYSQGLRWGWLEYSYLDPLVILDNQIPPTYVWNPSHLGDAWIRLPQLGILHHVQGLKHLEGLRSSLASGNHSIKGTLFFLMTLVTTLTVPASNRACLLLLMLFKKPLLFCTSKSWSLLRSCINRQCLCIPPKKWVSALL